MSRIQIFGHDGYALTDVIANADRSWSLSKYGRCEFTIPVISDKCRRRYLEYGNFVLIQHPSLPAWGGMIDPPRTWGNNKVTVTAYTAEYILNYRRVGFDTLKVTEGGLFAHAIDIANKVDDSRIFKAAPIDESGVATTYELREEIMYTYLRNKLTYEWHFVPVLDNGRLLFEASLYEKFVNIKDFNLKDGYNIERSDDTLTEDGKIYTAYLGLGKGSSWGNRYQYKTEDTEASGRYGYREGLAEVDSRDVATIEETANKELKKNKKAQDSFDLSAIDKDGTFKQLDLGNVLHASMSVCGFTGDKVGKSADVRITGMTYLENKGVCRLICEEYDESE